MATITLKKRTVPVQTDQKKRTSKKMKTIVLNVYSVMLLLVLIIMGTSFLYLSEFNDIASQGVIISELESERNRLIIENEVWNMRIAQLKSLDVIEQQPVVKRMITINPAEIEFINLEKQASEAESDN